MIGIGKEIKYIYDMRRKEDEKTDQEKRNRLADVWNNDDGGGIYRMREKDIDYDIDGSGGKRTAEAFRISTIFQSHMMTV